MQSLVNPLQTGIGGLEPAQKILGPEDIARQQKDLEFQRNLQDRERLIGGPQQVGLGPEDIARRAHEADNMTRFNRDVMDRFRNRRIPTETGGRLGSPPGPQQITGPAPLGPNMVPPVGRPDPYK